jgi:hypothetical protein
MLLRKTFVATGPKVMRIATTGTRDEAADKVESIKELGQNIFALKKLVAITDTVDLRSLAEVISKAETCAAG